MDTIWRDAGTVERELFVDIGDNDPEYRYYDLLDKISVCLVNYRVKRGMSQTELARQLGVSQTMISKYESGDYNFSLKSIIELLAALDMHFRIEVGEEEADTLQSVSSMNYKNVPNQKEQEANPEDWDELAAIA